MIRPSLDRSRTIQILTGLVVLAILGGSVVRFGVGSMALGVGSVALGWALEAARQRRRARRAAGLR